MDLAFEAPFAEQPAALTAAQPVNDRWVLGEGPFGPLHYVSRVFVPEEVSAGGAVDVEVDVTNEARSVLSPVDENECTQGARSGLESTVTVTPSWTSSESVTLCTEVAGTSNTVDTFETDFTAPDEAGTYNVTVDVTTPDGSGGAVEYDVVVLESGGDPRPDPEPEPDPDPDPGDGNPLENLIDTLTFGTDSAAVPLVILVVILVVLLYLTAI